MLDRLIAEKLIADKKKTQAIGDDESPAPKAKAKAKSKAKAAPNLMNIKKQVKEYQQHWT